MRIFHACVFDSFIQGSATFTAVAYSDPKFDLMLGAAETATIVLVVDQVLGSSPTITAQIETSPDRRNWFAKNTSAEVPAAALNPIANQVTEQVKVGYDTGTSNTKLGAGFNRLMLSMGAGSGNSSCRVRAYVTGHAEGLYRR